MDSIQNDDRFKSALEQLKKWNAEGKTAETEEGLRQILNLDPENAEAKQLMSTINSSEIQTPSAAPIPETSVTQPATPEKKSHGILLNLTIIITLFIVVIGAFYAYKIFTADEPTEETQQTIEETPSALTDEVSQNDERFEDLTKIETKLKTYYKENRLYPLATEIEEALGELPFDPKDEGEFKYVYAVYDDGQEYILSGLFEDPDNGNTYWTTGASPSEYTDYRDVDLENVTYISSEKEPEIKKVKRVVE